MALRAASRLAAIGCSGRSGTWSSRRIGHRLSGLCVGRVCCRIAGRSLASALAVSLLFGESGTSDRMRRR